MRAIMLVVIAIMLTALSIIPSHTLAQEDQDLGCVRRMVNCVDTEGHILGCCPTFKEEMENERECFCLLMNHLAQNATTAPVVEAIFTECSFTESFDSTCSASSSTSPSSPSPATKNSTSSSPSTPSSVPSASTKTPTDEISTDSPSADAEGCWGRIGKCVKSADTRSDAMECCSVVNEEMVKEKECFCTVKTAMVEDPSAYNGFTKFFAMCDISISQIVAYCPDDGTTTTSSSTPSVPTTLPSPASPGSSSKDDETVLPSPGTPSLDTNKEPNNPTAIASQNGSTNKVANSIGLLPMSSLLFIWTIFVYV